MFCLDSVGVRSEQGGGVLETARSIVKAEGVRGLYRGLGASYWGLSEGAIQVLPHDTPRVECRVWGRVCSV